MESLLPARGCIYAYNPGGSSLGYYAMNPALKGTTDSPVLLLGAALNDDDIVLPKTTLDNFQILYSFGKGFGQVQINGMVLLGSQETGAGAGFQAVAEFFETHRTSVKKEPIQLSMPGKVAYNVFLTGFAVGQTDAQYNTQQFMFGGVVASPVKK